MSELRRLLDAMGYCRFCNRPGRPRKIGAAAEFFGGQSKIVLCESCWLRVVAPLVPRLHAIHNYQRRIKNLVRKEVK